jgi:hypothetical protein
MVESEKTSLTSQETLNTQDLVRIVRLTSRKEMKRSMVQRYIHVRSLAVKSMETISAAARTAMVCAR